MFDLNHPFFLPVWRRYVTIAVCLGWMAMEITGGETIWIVFASAMTVWAVVGLLVLFDEEKARAKIAPAPEDDA